MVAMGWQGVTPSLAASSLDSQENQARYSDSLRSLLIGSCKLSNTLRLTLALVLKLLRVDDGES